MLYTNNSSNEKFLIHADHVINSLEGSAEAASVMARYNYSAQHFAEGRQLLEQVNSANREYDALVRSQKNATAQFHAEWQKQDVIYQIQRQAAHRCLKNELGHILRSQQATYTGWIVDANRFYTEVLNNPEYLAKLNAVHVRSEELQLAQQAVAMLRASKSQQNQSQFSIRLMQQRKDSSLAEFKNWFAEMIGLARVAFRQQPSMLKLLRIMPSRLSSENKNEPAANGSSHATQPLAVAA